MHTYYLHLGSNKGDRTSYLSNAIKQIAAIIGQVTDQSSTYQTEPWGKKDQDDFLNIAIKVESNLAPEEALNAAKQIESAMGSEKKEKWGPRIIDIDILYCDDLIMEKDNLVIPHPHIYERNFVLIPLMEIAGDFIDPVKEMSIEDIFDLCKDESEVLIFEE
ncbi:MAG TPA: 2-amino-4-hydroxy-6-hydroxymethyldihydropteridine diphosphokinase [Saprospiraceae bacterium]|nr:2-amino-4-hydroxy-6-hydroxymethyldihydropteridine diphosphokinase [Saprospiraceae bacterium]HMU05774.1 2-amino-4-hydroxy-6-hydroxymethyldihydropteridine diphosphokinase [Saprospiraceae bacterium]